MPSSEKIKISARPPESAKENDLDAAMSFIRDDSPPRPSTHTSHPWKAAREDVLKTFNLRLPEEYALKLEFLSDKKKISKHEICIAAVRREIDRLIKEHI